MSNLLKLSPDFRVVLPDGATGATGEIRYQRAYKVALLLAGAPSSFKVVPEAQGSRLGKLTSLDGGDVRLLGAMNGDPEPPYVELVIYPTFPNTPGRMGRGEPVILSGRPHEYPPGSDSWDLSDLGANPNGATVTSREEKLNLVAATAEARVAAQKITTAQLDFQKEKDTVTGFVDGQVARVDRAVAETAQSEADARVAAGEARATGAEVLERFSGLRWRAYDAEQMYVDGNRVLLALVDASDQPLMYWDTLGICHLPAGLDIPNAPEKPVDLPQLSTILASGLVNSLSTRQAIKTPGLTLSASWQYANGEEVAPLLMDKAGALLWLLRRSGVLDAPGGLSTAGVATTRQSGGYADGAEVLDVLRADMQGNLMAFFDTTGALHVPGGLVAPGVGGGDSLGELLPVSTGDIWCVGDSMTEGAGSTSGGGGAYGQRVAKLLGRKYRIDGLGGNTSCHIAGRIGATRVMLTADATVPADGSRVPVMLNNPILRGSGNRMLGVTVGDVAMTLSHENHNPDGSVTEASQDSPHYLQRAAAGEAVTLMAGTAVVPVIPTSAPQSTTIIWAGRNNPYDIGDIVQDVRATVNLLREHVVSPRYIVLPVMPSTTGSINDSPLSDAREALRREHGERFFDAHVPLLTDAQGRLRSEYAISDGLHWNDAGYSVLASQLASYLRWKGW